MEFTIKIVNTPDHSLFPSGREYYFLINSEHKVQELIKMIDYFIYSESYKLVSNYWHYLNKMDKIIYSGHSTN